MSCNCKLHLKRFNKLKKKYSGMRKNYKKLIGVAILLTDALEKLLQGGDKAKINETLLMCSSIYSDMYSAEKITNQKNDDGTNEEPKNVFIEVADESGKPSESEKEYFEGFMARPRIPRTPQI